MLISVKKTKYGAIMYSHLSQFLPVLAIYSEDTG
jgi:hypothetical protein